MKLWFSFHSDCHCAGISTGMLLSNWSC